MPTSPERQRRPYWNQGNERFLADMAQRSSCVFIEEQVRAWSPPQHGLGVIGNHRYHGKKSGVSFFPIFNFITSSL
jgi:hypothetical protein